MRRRSILGIALAAAAFTVPACGSRTGLLSDGLLGSSLTGLDASLLDDASDASDASDADGAIVIPEAFVCPHRALDLCGDDAYQPGAPWPTYQRCSSHTGRTNAIGPTNPVVLWGQNTGGALLSPPTIASDGTVYVGGGGGMSATNPSGALRWNAQPSIFNTGSSAAAIGPDGTIYFALDRVYAFNADGSLKWSGYQLAYPGPQSSYATLSSPGASITLGPCGTLFVGSPTGLHIMDANGNTIWDTSGQGLTPAVDPNGSAYYGTADGRLIAVNPDGSTRWVYTLNDADGGGLDAGGAARWVMPAPILGPDGTIYFGESVAFEAISATGKKLWSLPWGTDAGAPLIGAALAADGTVYVAFPDHTLRAIAPDGTQKWSLPMDVYGTSPIIDGNGTIFELGSDGVYAITPSGQIAWVITLPGGISENGTLAMGGDGTIYASTQGVYAVGNAP